MKASISPPRQRQRLVAPVTKSATALGASGLDGMYGGVEAGDPMPGAGAWDPMSFGELHDLVKGSEHAGVMPHPSGSARPRSSTAGVAMLAFTALCSRAACTSRARSTASTTRRA
ncbi:light harvesting protein [Aureococcus anophagefferens]|nr:light harvesting protein [Aureococcus anophagefferens]